MAERKGPSEVRDPPGRGSPGRLPAEPAAERFECAFIAVSHLLGRRGERVLEPLPGSCAAARSLARALGLGERQDRARRLAVALVPVVSALSHRTRP